MNVIDSMAANQLHTLWGCTTEAEGNYMKYLQRIEQTYIIRYDVRALGKLVLITG
jgi:hypothetical protein